MMNPDARSRKMRTRIGRTVVGTLVPGWVLVFILVEVVIPPAQERTELLISAGAFWLALVIFLESLFDLTPLAVLIDRVANSPRWRSWWVIPAILLFSILFGRWIW